MADNAEAFSRITVFADFENAIRSEHEKFDSSAAYPGYTGLGAKPATKTYTNINNLKNQNQVPKGFKLDKDGNPPKWMVKLPCFTCGEIGHTLHTCDCKPPKCNIDGCKIEHTSKAHKKYVEAKAKTAEKGQKGNNNKTGVRAVTSNDDETPTPQPTGDPGVNIPMPVWHEMQNNLRQVMGNQQLNDASHNMRVHIFDSKTDSVMNDDQAIEISNISKIKTQVQCSNTLDNDVMNYVNSRVKQLEEEKIQLIKKKR